MKKLICLVLIFVLMLTACSKWEIEIVDPTKPVEGESELIAPENEKEEKPVVSESDKIQENNGIQENDEPSVYEYAIMKIYESEEISQKDFVELSESEKEELISALNAESWTDVPEDWEADEALSGPVNLIQTIARDNMYISSDGEKTLITIEWGRDAKKQKFYHAPKEVAQNMENLRKEVQAQVLSEAEEPEIEEFSRLLVYGSDDYNITHAFSNEELSEWLSVLNPEEWKENSDEKEGGSLNKPIILSRSGRGALYIGTDQYGDEIALFKWGRMGNLTKSYIMPEGTLSSAKAFEKRMIRENPNIFTYPECLYDMSANAFLNRENDDYILYLADFLDCMRWNALVAETGKEYSGFSSPSELDGRVMFNQFMFVFDKGFTENGSLTQDAWYSYADERYHIPMADIHTVLGKYFADYSFEFEDHINYEEEYDSVVILQGYPVSSFRGETEVVSVTDNGNGTLTAVLESRLYHLDESDNMVLSENPEERSTIVFHPEDFRCLILSHKIESIGD